jgi:hypothetical protein
VEGELERDGRHSTFLEKPVGGLQAGTCGMGFCRLQAAICNICISSAGRRRRQKGMLAWAVGMMCCCGRIGRRGVGKAEKWKKRNMKKKKKKREKRRTDPSFGYFWFVYMYSTDQVTYLPSHS